MARIRSIKPEFWDSPDTAKADLRTRLLYIAMWNWADDYGIGDASPVRLIGFAFPTDDIPAADYPRLLADVSDAFGVVFFEHEGRRFFAIPAWEQHQRTEKKAKPKAGLVEAAKTAVAQHKTAGSSYESDAPVVGGGFSDDSVGASEESGGSSFLGTGEVGTGERETPSGEEAAAPPRPRAVKSDKVKAPEQIATTNAYERVGKAFKFVSVLQIAKWAIHVRNENPGAVEDAVVALYEMGKPITKQTVGQYLDGHLARSPNNGGPSKGDQKVQGWLEVGGFAPANSNSKEIVR